MTNLATPAEAKRTPPDLKWLLNERAAMAGRIQKAQTQRKFFDDKIAAAERKYLAVVRKYAEPTSRIQEELNRHTEVLRALDTTIKLVCQQIRCDAAGILTPWAGRYGKRGALNQFIQQVLQDAAPKPVSVTALVDACVVTFALELRTSIDRRHLKDSVRTTLRHLRSRGLAEKYAGPLEVPGHFNSLAWCWRNPHGATALRAMVAAAQSLSDSGSSTNDLPNPT